MRKAFITFESEDETTEYYDSNVAYDDVKREGDLNKFRNKEILVL